MPLTLPRDWWGYHWSSPRPLSIVELLRANTFDAELGALLWLLLEARVPLVVAAEPPLAGKSTTLTALLDFLPPDARTVVLRGRYETFDWLPEAAELGWPVDLDAGTSPGARPAAASAPPRSSAAESAAAQRSVDAANGYLLASELSSHLPGYTWGLQARIAVRAAGHGYGLGTTIHADSLAEVRAQLQAPPVALQPDELAALGVVLVLRMFRADGSVLAAGHGSAESEMAPLELGVARRVVVAHYLRPPDRDVAGLPAPRPDAVLARWNPTTDTLQHSSLALVPELAARTGRSPAEFLREQRSRAVVLADLLERRAFRRGDVLAAIDAYRRDSSAAARPLAASALRPDRPGPAVSLPIPPEPS